MSDQVRPEGIFPAGCDSAVFVVVPAEPEAGEPEEPAAGPEWVRISDCVRACTSSCARAAPPISRIAEIPVIASLYMAQPHCLIRRDRLDNRAEGAPIARRQCGPAAM